MSRLTQLDDADVPVQSPTMYGGTTGTDPADGDVLSFDGTSKKWKNTALAGAAFSTLAGDTDVNISSPADGDTLTFDAASGKWKNSAPTGGVGTVPLTPIYPLPKLPVSGSGTWNTGSFPTGLTLFIRVSGRKLISGCSKFRVALSVNNVNLVIQNAIIRKTNLEGTAWVDVGTNITWGGSGTPTFSTVGEQNSDLISYSITPDYDYYIIVDINRSTTTGSGSILAYSSANDPFGALATGFTTNGTDTTAAASAANFTGNGNYFFTRFVGE